jgi:bla regulator protein BlaR1
MNENYVAPFLSYAINHLWQSTLFAALAWLLVVTLLRNNRPQTRYAVWLAASIKFLVPFAALIDVGSHLGWMKFAAPKTQVTLYYAMDQVSRRAAPQFVPSALRPTIPAPGSHIPSLLLIVWACGFVVIAMRWWLSWRRVREAVDGAAPMQMFDGIPVYSSPALRERGLEPGVFGLSDPVVLVPDGITERLSPEQFDAVLTHECCHARRRDNLAAAIHMVVEALFWFHPLVWWLGYRMMQERERACDEEVLRRTSDPEVYAEGILNVCKFYLESPLVCVAGITGSNLKRRIEEIMSHRMARELNWARTALLAVAAVTTVAGPIGIGLLQTPVTRAQTPGQTPSSFTGIATSAAKQFEVATAKVNHNTDSQYWRLGPPAHGSISIENLPLHKIVASSFRVQDSMVFGPAWMDSVRYDIVGKGPDPKATNPEVWEMMRALLADRFQMKYHIETRQLPICADGGEGRTEAQTPGGWTVRREDQGWRELRRHRADSALRGRHRQHADRRSHRRTGPRASGSSYRR